MKQSRGNLSLFRILLDFSIIYHERAFLPPSPLTPCGHGFILKNKLFSQLIKGFFIDVWFIAQT